MSIIRQDFGELSGGIILETESGTVSTSSATRTITLNNSYSEMVGIIIKPTTSGYIADIANATFTAPNIVTFEIKTCYNNTLTTSSTAQNVTYEFKGTK